MKELLPARSRGLGCWLAPLELKMHFLARGRRPFPLRPLVHHDGPATRTNPVVSTTVAYSVWDPVDAAPRAYPLFWRATAPAPPGGAFQDSTTPGSRSVVGQTAR